MYNTHPTKASHTIEDKVSVCDCNWLSCDDALCL